MAETPHPVGASRVPNRDAIRSSGFARPAPRFSDLSETRSHVQRRRIPAVRTYGRYCSAEASHPEMSPPPAMSTRPSVSRVAV